MTLKDLTSFLAPNLKLPWKDRVFEVEPPTKEVGLTLTALNATGIGAYIAMQGACESCGRSGEIELTETQRALVDAASEKDLGELTLGGAYQEMTDAGVPGPDLDMFSLYAFYYWTMGESTADSIIAEQYKKPDTRPVPKDRLPRKNTSNTGSASQSAKTKTASKSTPTTDSQKN